MQGTPFGRFRLVELLGRGGMGEVWRAYDTVTDRTVAVKLLPPHLAEDDIFVERFRREAHAAARLNSPHVIPIHGYGEIEGRLYVDMRLIEGRDLQTVLDHGPLPPTRAVRIIEQVATALNAAHKIGLVHRDVKPSNILLDEDDFAYLIDFGLARGADQRKLTSTSTVIGTWAYMSPERMRSGEVDARADIYALACVLYECLTGSPPFPGDTFESQALSHLADPPPRPSSARPELSNKFDSVIQKGMAKDPDDRYATTVELAREARDAVTAPIPRPTTSAPPKPPASGVPTRAHPGPSPTGSTPPPYFAPSDGAGTFVPAHRNTPSAGGPDPSPPPPPYPGAGPVLDFPTGPRPAPRRPRPNPWILGIIAVVVLLIGAGITGYLAIKGQPHPESGSTSTAQPTPTAPPTPTYRQVMLPFTGLNTPNGVAVDVAGDVFVIDSSNLRVMKLVAGSSTPTALPFTGLIMPAGVAVDGAGSVYVTHYGNQVVKLATGSNTQTLLPFTDLHGAEGVAVDSAGNVYVADTNGNRVVKLAAGSSTQTVVPFTGLNLPNGVAVDTAGNVYVADYGHNRVVELAAGSNAQTVLNFTGLSAPIGVAADSAGTVYVVDSNLNRVVKLAAGPNTQTMLPFTGLKGPAAVAVDKAGNVYVADQGNNRVLKLTTG